jgi:hypothetical protein
MPQFASSRIAPTAARLSPGARSAAPPGLRKFLSLQDFAAR